MGFYNIIYILKCFLTRKVKLFIVALLLVVSLIFLLTNKSNAESLVLDKFTFNDADNECIVDSNIYNFIYNSNEYKSGEYKYIYFSSQDGPIVQFVNKNSNLSINITFLISSLDWGDCSFEWQNYSSNDSFIYYILDDNGEPTYIGNSLYNGTLNFYKNSNECFFTSTINMFYEGKLFYGSPSMFHTIYDLTSSLNLDNIFLAFTLCLSFLSTYILFVLGLYLIRKTQGGIK